MYQPLYGRFYAIRGEGNLSLFLYNFGPFFGQLFLPIYPIIYLEGGIHMAEYDNHTNSYGLGVAGTTLGSIGTALGLANGGLGSLLGGIGTGTSQFVTKEAFEMAQRIAAKDSEIALLKSEQNTEVKIADVYERLITRINADAKAQAEVNAAQSVMNNQMTNNIAVLNNNVAMLQSLTKVVVPATSICPEPMSRYNSWTAPTD